MRPLLAPLKPLEFGLWGPPNALRLFEDVVSASGNPDCMLTIPFTCQPPRMALTTGFQSLPKALPWPNGISALALKMKRCVTSSTFTDRSAARS